MAQWLKKKKKLKKERKNLPAMQDMWVQSLGREDPLEEERVGHD